MSRQELFRDVVWRHGSHRLGYESPISSLPLFYYLLPYRKANVTLYTACGNATALGMIKRSVINMSIGGSTYQPLDDMVQHAYAQGMTVVVAASNYGADACTYSPARGANATTVAAIDKSDGRPGWSNWGACVDLFAPGVDITSAWPDADGRAYATLSGTSMGEFARPLLFHKVNLLTDYLPNPPLMFPSCFVSVFFLISYLMAICFRVYGIAKLTRLLVAGSLPSCCWPGNISDVARESVWRGCGSASADGARHTRHGARSKRKSE